MGKFFGIDLGTNSIGWAIRDSDTIEDNQIIDKGVVIFKKGVGDGKSGEYSLAAERRINRSKRRLYNAKRYRKWALLKVLIENGMCPISEEELRLWSIGKWENHEKNRGRIYPVSPDFRCWLAMDFDKIGKEHIEGEKIKPQFENPYILRCHLIENQYDLNQLTRYKIGRAFYHLVQRRGFKTSRKSGKSSYAKNEELEILKENNPNIQISQVLQSKLQNENKRIRNSGVIQRRYFEDEFYKICQVQELNISLIEKLYKAIYHVRPLRTQKGLVGNCTLEKGKPRIPISHPKFEEFRALTFINNIKWRIAGNKNYEQLPISIRKQILQDIFFEIKKDGNIDQRTYFEFKKIIEKYSENGTREFNYKNLPIVAACPVIAGLMNSFADTWQDKFIENGNIIGINWDGLNIDYQVKYGNDKGKKRTLNYEGIWHLLFDYIQTKDNQSELEQFCKNVLLWNEEKVKRFSEIDIAQGYGSLSHSAISKILPYLQDGYIYSEAVVFANLKKALGENFNGKISEAKKIIAETIKTVLIEKEKLNIVNSLIQQFFFENEIPRAKGVDIYIKKIALNDVRKKLLSFYGENEWNSKSENERKIIEDIILEKYLLFLDGKQKNEEKSSVSQNKNPEIDYYKIPRLDEAIKSTLKISFGAIDENLKHLYHPSDIDIYPKSITMKLGDPQPPSKGWKNPMALRTMHELKKLMNYLLSIGKIDENTKIVVEMARELNDANKRWAIKTYQKNREEENIEFAKAIIGVAKEKYANLDENNAENISKVRLWWEQLENCDELFKQIKSLKEDVQKYRLWKEQECQCMYTGEVISLTDLFDGTKTHFEHTLPISASFDNSFSNLTVCKASYNTQIKKNQIPTQLKNYSEFWNGYSPIEPRLKNWQKKVDHLKNLIDENKIRTHRTFDPDSKKVLIQKRHLLQFDFDYWSKKLKTFTVTEIPNYWKNSQLVDTQIITKYARAYLKTVFQKVEVQKGSITSDFRKIYGIMGDEKKDRSKHSHHAIDAAVLTLIPGSARRDDILSRYYEASETKQKFHVLPYPGFNISHLTEIENEILINHITQDRTLTQTLKKVKRRGNIEFIRDKNTGKFKINEKGNKISKIMRGDTIRGQLHKETFFGKIKVVERNVEGFALKDDDGKYILKQKNNTDEIWVVARKMIQSVNFEKDIIVDELLKRHLIKQLESGKEVHELVDFNNKPLRHIRCRVKAGVGFLSQEKTISIKPHVFLSKYKHKSEVLAQNEENYLYLLYEGENDKGKVVRGYQILNLFDMVQLKITNINQIKRMSEFQKLIKNKTELKLKAVLRVGDRVIFYREKKEEILKDISKDNIKKRLFRILKFNEVGSVESATGYLYCQFHLEARPDNELDDGDTGFNPDNFQPRLKISPDHFNCLIERVDFKLTPDGEIKFNKSFDN